MVFDLELEMYQCYRVTMLPMSDTLTNVVSLSQRLAALQKQLAELDADRARVNQQINTCMAQLSATVPPPTDGSTRSRVLWVLHQFEESALAPMDICSRLNISHFRDQANVRLLLMRMCREGRVRRISHGRYQINRNVR